MTIPQNEPTNLADTKAADAAAAAAQDPSTGSWMADLDAAFLEHGLRVSIAARREEDTAMAVRLARVDARLYAIQRASIALGAFFATTAACIGWFEAPPVLAVVVGVLATYSVMVFTKEDQA